MNVDVCKNLYKCHFSLNSNEKNKQFIIWLHGYWFVICKCLDILVHLENRVIFVYDNYGKTYE